MTRYYVTMTDKSMSGWGMAEGKINKLVLVCYGLNEAVIVESNAKARPEMKYVNICTTVPHYNKDRYLEQVKTRADYPGWYKAGYFKPIK